MKPEGTLLLALLIAAVVTRLSTEDASEPIQDLSTPEPDPENYLCAMSRLRQFQAVSAMVFYSITPDCMLFAWRDGYIPTNLDMGGNNSAPLILNSPKGDSIGDFMRPSGASRRCEPFENNILLFVDRAVDMYPQLVLLVSAGSGTRTLLKLDVDKMLKEQKFIHSSLLPLFSSQGVPVMMGDVKPETCILVDSAVLHCYSIVNGDLVLSVFRLGTDVASGNTVYATREEWTTNFGKMKLSRFSPIMAATWNDRNSSNLYLFDPLKDGWLFKLNAGGSTASGRRIQDMHKIYKMGNNLKSLYAMDKNVLLASKCDSLICEYFWIQVGPVANSPRTCLFSSRTDMLVGVLSNVWLPPLLPEIAGAGGNNSNAPGVAAASTGIFNVAASKYWAIILLAVVIIVVILCLVFCACAMETFGFKRRQLLEETVNQRYANYFWPNAMGKELRVSIEDLTTGNSRFLEDDGLGGSPAPTPTSPFKKPDKQQLQQQHQVPPGARQKRSRNTQRRYFDQDDSDISFKSKYKTAQKGSGFSSLGPFRAASKPDTETTVPTTQVVDTAPVVPSKERISRRSKEKVSGGSKEKLQKASKERVSRKSKEKVASKERVSNRSKERASAEGGGKHNTVKFGTKTWIEERGKTKEVDVILGDSQKSSKMAEIVETDGSSRPVSRMHPRRWDADEEPVRDIDDVVNNESLVRPHSSSQTSRSARQERKFYSHKNQGSDGSTAVSVNLESEQPRPLPRSQSKKRHVSTRGGGNSETSVSLETITKPKEKSLRKERRFSSHKNQQSSEGSDAAISVDIQSEQPSRRKKKKERRSTSRKAKEKAKAKGVSETALGARPKEPSPLQRTEPKGDGRRFSSHKNPHGGERRETAVSVDIKSEEQRRPMARSPSPGKERRPVSRKSKEAVQGAPVAVVAVDKKRERQDTRARSPANPGQKFSSHKNQHSSEAAVDVDIESEDPPPLEGSRSSSKKRKSSSKKDRETHRGVETPKSPGRQPQKSSLKRKSESKRLERKFSSHTNQGADGSTAVSVNVEPENPSPMPRSQPTKRDASPQKDQRGSAAPETRVSPEKVKKPSPKQKSTSIRKEQKFSSQMNQKSSDDAVISVDMKPEQSSDKKQKLERKSTSRKEKDKVRGVSETSVSLEKGSRKPSPKERSTSIRKEQKFSSHMNTNQKSSDGSDAAISVDMNPEQSSDKKVTPRKKKVKRRSKTSASPKKVKKTSPKQKSTSIRKEQKFSSHQNQSNDGSTSVSINADPENPSPKPKPRPKKRDSSSKKNERGGGGSETSVSFEALAKPKDKSKKEQKFSSHANQKSSDGSDAAISVDTKAEQSSDKNKKKKRKHKSRDNK